MYVTKELYIFWINLPILIAGYVLVWRYAFNNEISPKVHKYASFVIFVRTPKMLSIGNFGQI